MKRTSKLLALLLSLALSLSLVSCAPAAGPTTPGTDEKPMVYRRMYGSEVTTLNYLYTGNTNDLRMSANTVDCLVEYDPYGVIIPSLAESWSSNADNTEWTFKIRPDVKWVDATGAEKAAVTANDWVSAAKWVLESENQSGTMYMYGGIVKNAQEYYDYTAYLLASENGTKTTDEAGAAIDVVAPVDFADVGVKAVDDATLVYTMEQPTPYFPSVLSYASYMPVYGPFLDEMGTSFGVDHNSILYNGAYIMSEYEPQNHRTLVKNPTYWDKDNVHITQMDWLYNQTASNLAPESFLRGEVDWAEIGSSILSAWLEDPKTKDLVSPTRPDTSYSYFYAFNFEPRFDAAYEPANWSKAVNSENFRLSILHALDKLNAKKVAEPYTPELLILNTITPPNFAVGAGVDFTQYPALKNLTEKGSFDVAAATDYKAKAMAELTAAGATFPVKVLMPYNPDTNNWDKECQVVEQQLEAALGTDYIDIIVQAGPATNFLGEIRRGGKFGLMKCNWGADYADPQTWTDPFNNASSTKNSSYNWMYTVEDAVMAGTPAVGKTTGTQSLITEYAALLAKAKAITNDEAARYTAFSEAEAFLINHAIVIPYSIDSSWGYIATKSNELEGQYAPYGLALTRFKYLTVGDTALTLDQYKGLYSQWETDRTAAQAAAQ